jgi:hypothetical protein
MTNQDNISFRDTGALGEPAAGSPGIGKDSGFLGRALTLPIPSIIKDQDGSLKPIPVQAKNGFAGRHTFGVAMGIEYHGSRLIRARKSPVEANPIGRLQPDLLISGFLRGPARRQRMLPLKYQRLFEAHQG